MKLCLQFFGVTFQDETTESTFPLLFARAVYSDDKFLTCLEFLKGVIEPALLEDVVTFKFLALAPPEHPNLGDLAGAFPFASFVFILEDLLIREVLPTSVP